MAGWPARCASSAVVAGRALPIVAASISILTSGRFCLTSITRRWRESGAMGCPIPILIRAHTSVVVCALSIRRALSPPRPPIDNRLIIIVVSSALRGAYRPREKSVAFFGSIDRTRGLLLSLALQIIYILLHGEHSYIPRSVKSISNHFSTQ